jgi:hypothetical protein
MHPMKAPAKADPPPLPRAASWADWEKGRAARRELCRRLTGGKILRRERGDPRKDRLLRALNKGERGLPFIDQ